jgi:hypothetical protein
MQQRGIGVHTRRLSAAIAAATAAVVTLSACSGSQSGTEASATTSAAVSATTSAAPAGTEAHNGADAAFAQGMIPHHQQAIEMSDMPPYRFLQRSSGLRLGVDSAVRASQPLVLSNLFLPAR